MHLLRHPRNAAMVGIVFVVIGLVYWGVQEVADFTVDFAGVTMLVALGAAMALMAYVLVAGSPRD